MARRSTPPLAYGDDVTLGGGPVVSSDSSGPASPIARPAQPAAAAEPQPVRRPILDRSEPTVIYLHPDGKHQLRTYAVAQGLKVKVHDLLLEAVEEWGSRRGLKGPFRTPQERPRRT